MRMKTKAAAKMPRQMKIAIVMSSPFDSLMLLKMTKAAMLNLRQLSMM